MRDREINIQNIPIPLTPEQRRASNAIRDALSPKRNCILSQIDFAGIELLLAELLSKRGGK